MTPDLETLLTALYVEIDDYVIPSGQPRPGQPKKLSDAELVCLRLKSVQLTAHAMPVEGLVVGQTPPPGQRVRHNSMVTVQLWFPPEPGR